MAGTMNDEPLKTYSDEELSRYIDKLGKRLKALTASENYRAAVAARASRRVEVTQNLLYTCRDELESRIAAEKRAGWLEDLANEPTYESHEYHPSRVDGLDRNLRKLKKVDWEDGMRCICKACCEAYASSRASSRRHRELS